MKSIIKIICTMLMCVGMLWPVHSSVNAQSESVIVEDAFGHEINLANPAKKIVTLQPSDAEILVALGLGERIIGRGMYVDFPIEEVENIPTLGTGTEINVEEIIALQPDLVIADQISLPEDEYKMLLETGIEVLMIKTSDIDEIYNTIGLIAKATGEEAEGEILVNSMRNLFELIRTESEKHELSGSVYFEVSPLEFGLWTAGSNTFMNEIANIIGLHNIFEDVESWSEISEEQVIERNPDYIVTISMPSETTPDPIVEIKERKGWESITAVTNNHIVLADSNEMSRPGPRLVQAAKLLYEYISGEELVIE